MRYSIFVLVFTVFLFNCVKTAAQTSTGDEFCNTLSTVIEKHADGWAAIRGSYHYLSYSKQYYESKIAFPGAASGTKITEYTFFGGKKSVSVEVTLAADTDSSTVVEAYNKYFATLKGCSVTTGDAKMVDNSKDGFNAVYTDVIDGADKLRIFMNTEKATSKSEVYFRLVLSISLVP